MKLALAQLNPLIGDLLGNAEIIKETCFEAAKNKTDLVVTPELSLWGYPPRDLLLNPLLLKRQTKILNELHAFVSRKTPSLGVLVGIAEQINDRRVPNLFNSIAIIDKYGWKVIARKQLLPTYDVFDEKRYFRNADKSGRLEQRVGNKTWHLGITICEDLWVEDNSLSHRLDGNDPIAQLITPKIDILINLSASPFEQGKESIRQHLAKKAVERLRCPVIYVNQVGGNDELIFDGGSFIMNSSSKVAKALPKYQEAIAYWDINSKNDANTLSCHSPNEELFRALVLGLKDYARKCGFQSVLIGLSGGIDSALVTTIATAALGKKQVSAVLMPSPWTGINSIQDAHDLAKRLDINTYTIPIETLMENYDNALSPSLGESPKGTTSENLQSRIRGTLLMALANQQGHLLLSTGNKSELAVGYCTLYGDMNGGLSVIGDLYKTTVFSLCNWLDGKNSYKCREEVNLPVQGELVGAKIRQKAPSAELRPGQLDSDSLPDYAVLDPILKALIEDKVSPEELINAGKDASLIRRIEILLKKGEFKRRQAPPLLKVSPQAFGSGWRLPIAAT